MITLRELPVCFGPCIPSEVKTFRILNCPDDKERPGSRSMCLHSTVDWHRSRPRQFVHKSGSTCAKYIRCCATDRRSDEETILKKTSTGWTFSMTGPSYVSRTNWARRPRTSGAASLDCTLTVTFLNVLLYVLLLAVLDHNQLAYTYLKNLGSK